MKSRFKQLHEKDNIAVALQSLTPSDYPKLQGEIPPKHKFALQRILQGEPVIMYGVCVGVATEDIPIGSHISKHNTADPTRNGTADLISFRAPAVISEDWSDRTFQGIRRPDGKVGTANYWIFIPLVFCENQNLRVLEDTLKEALGYRKPNPYLAYAHELLGEQFTNKTGNTQRFKHIDGIRFLYHQGGCGGTREDSESLMRLLAGYVHHPNVAGATILSLGCQNAQLEQFRSIEEEMFAGSLKPRIYLEHQQIGDEDSLMCQAIRETIEHMENLPVTPRVPVPLSELVIGLECGGSDGFSGITANPLVGEVSDLISALGGKSILAEFPELSGMETEIIHRCKDAKTAGRFQELFNAYAARAEAIGARFEQNPSPGNIREGLVTLAMKSAGAVKKGGVGPINDVLDYTEQVKEPGLNLLCTPGNDVESTTAIAASGANLILFTTGLGTPTGNPIVPVVKISSNSKDAMSDIIDFDAGRLITADMSMESLTNELMELIIRVAGGENTCAMDLEQNDFIPWKRGISL